MFNGDFYPLNDSDGVALPKIDDIDECEACRIFGDNYDSDICLCRNCSDSPIIHAIDLNHKISNLEDRLLTDRYNEYIDQLIDDLPF